MKNYYEVLGLPVSATEEDIKRQYRKLRTQYINDEEKTAEINAAWDVLRDKKKRAEYDSELKYGNEILRLENEFRNSNDRDEKVGILKKLSELYKNLLRENQQLYGTWFKLYDAYLGLGEHTKAENILERLYKISDSIPDKEEKLTVLDRLSEEYLKKDEIEKAFVVLTKIFDSDITYEYANDSTELARIYYEKKNDYKKAFEILNQIMKKAKDRVDKVRACCECIRAIKLRNGGGTEKLEQALKANINKLNTEDYNERINICNMLVQMVASLEDYKNRDIFIKEIRSVYSIFKTDNTDMNAVFEEGCYIYQFIDNSKYKEVFEILGKDSFELEDRIILSQKILSDFSGIKGELESLKKDMPMLFSHTKDFQDFEKLLNENTELFTECESFNNNLFFKGEFKKFVNYLFYPLVSFDEKLDDMRKCFDISFDELNIDRTRWMISKMENDKRLSLISERTKSFIDKVLSNDENSSYSDNLVIGEPDRAMTTPRPTGNINRQWNGTEKLYFGLAILFFLIAISSIPVTLGISAFPFGYMGVRTIQAVLNGDYSDEALQRKREERKKTRGKRIVKVCIFIIIVIIVLLIISNF